MSASCLFCRPLYAFLTLFESCRHSSHGWFCREKYIKAQLAKRLGRQGKGTETGKGDTAKTLEDELYSIPDNLKVCPWLHREASNYMLINMQVRIPPSLFVSKVALNTGCLAGAEGKPAGFVILDDRHSGSPSADGLQAEEH